VGHLYPVLLVGPATALVGVGILYPLGYLTYLSVHQYSPFYQREMIFTGLTHYQKLVLDARFWASLQASTIWVIGSVVPQFLLGLVMALLLNERFPGNGAVRSVILLPWVVSGVVTGIIWSWLFDGTVGVISDLLMRIGVVNAPIAWGVQPASAWFMVLVANAWRGAPFFAIMLLAALQSIPSDLYEAAKVDGADRWDRFRDITLPLITNTIILSTLLRAIWTFNYVDLLWTMTHGGPTNSTRTLAIDILQVAYIDGDFGYAAALSVALVIVLLAFSGLYWRLHRFGHVE
jgi:multiple sugar transport system permease protein